MDGIRALSCDFSGRLFWEGGCLALAAGQSLSRGTKPRQEAATHSFSAWLPPRQSARISGRRRKIRKWVCPGGPCAFSDKVWEPMTMYQPAVCVASIARYLSGVPGRCFVCTHYVLDTP